MGIAQSTDLSKTAVSPGGFGEWLRGVIQRLCGKAANASVGITEEAAEESEGGEFVLAPGGYRVRVPQSTDVNHCVGEMLPSVRQGLSVLPPLPRVVVELLREIQDPNSTASSVAEIASSDPALAASLIRTVNAASVGLSRKISSVGDAISYLGFGAVKSMVVRLRLDEVLAPKSEKAAADAEDLWVHSLAVSYAADCLARRVSGVDSGFVTTLGLLHDIGKLAIIAQLPGEAEALRAGARDGSGAGALAREAQLLGVDHAGLGADLAAKWSLPADLVQAIRFHHRPGEAFHATDPRPLRQAVYLVHVANQLVKYCYAYADEIEIEAVTEEAFAMLGLEPSLAKLLDEKMRAAIGRAVIFADANSRRPATAPRRFLHLRCGDEAARAVAAIPNDPRVFEEGETVAAFFSADVPVAQIQADGIGADPGFEAGAKQVRFVTTATAGAIEKCVKAARAHLETMELPTETRVAGAIVLRSVLPNLLAISKPDDSVELAISADGNRLVMAIRSPALHAGRRLGTQVGEMSARKLAEADFANVLNLGWFERILIAGDGSAVMLQSK